MKKRLVIALTMSLMCAIAHSQESFGLHAITTETGLSQSTNEFLYRDQFGFVWISSLDGLNRFDGKSNRVYKPTADPHGMRGKNIQSPFWETPEGDIWFTTELAVNCFRRQKGAVTSYPIRTDTGALSEQAAYAFYLENNRFLWIAANRSLYRMDVWAPTQPAQCLIRDQFVVARCGVLTDKNGKVVRVYGCRWGFGPGLEYFDFDARYQLQHHQLLMDSGTQATTFYRVLKTDEQHIWLASDRGLVRLAHLHPSQVIQYNPEQSRTITPLQQLDKAIHIPYWSGRHRLLFFNTLQGRFETCRNDPWSKAIAPNARLDHLGLDRDGLVWAAVRGEGIWYGSVRKNFGQILPAYKPFSCVSLFENAPDDIWISDDSGTMLRYNGKDLQRSAWKSEGISQVFKDEYGQVWRLDSKELRQLDYRSQTWHHVMGMPENTYLMNSVYTSKGVLAVGTLNGLYILDIPTKTVKTISNDLTFSIGVDHRGNLWQSIENKLQIWEAAPDGSFVLKASLENKTDVRSFCVDAARGILWAGTVDGLLKIDPSLLVVERITPLSGLPNGYIYAIALDNKSRLWLSTNQGIVRFNPDVTPYPFKQYTTKDGLSSSEFNPGAVMTDRSGRIWMGGTKGVEVFQPDSVSDLGHEPQLAIVGLRIHDQEWKGDTAIEVLQRLELPYDQNTLRLEVAAMAYLDPENNRFKVQLQIDGVPTSWTDLGSQHFVTFANVKPGRYTFRVIACNAEGIWTPEQQARSLQIIIHPHWSDTWWFRWLLGATLLGIVAAITSFYFRYRLRAQQLLLEKQQREAERRQLELEKTAAVAVEQRKVTESEMKLLRSQLNPHFLFNAMNSVNRYILSNEREKASEFLGQFARLTRSILDNSRSLTIPLSDELNMLQQYLALENHRFQQQIHWTVTISETLDPEDVLVPSMLLQPFVENAVLHGLAPKGGGQIDINIDENGDCLRCTIRDNGVGRQYKTPMEGNKQGHASAGMRLITERIDAFAQLSGQTATIAIHDLLDQAGQPAGTEVVVQLPLVTAI